MHAETPIELVVGKTMTEAELDEVLVDVRDCQWGHRPYRTPLWWAAGADCPHGNEDSDHPEHIGYSWPDGEVLCLLRPAGYGCSECESEDCEADARRSWLADDITALWWLVSDDADTPQRERSAS
jgi:hypothetical protein